MMDRSIKEMRGMNELFQIIAHAQASAVTFTFSVFFYTFLANIVSAAGLILHVTVKPILIESGLERHTRGATNEDEHDKYIVP